MCDNHVEHTLHSWLRCIYRDILVIMIEKDLDAVFSYLASRSEAAYVTLLLGPFVLFSVYEPEVPEYAVIWLGLAPTRSATTLERVDRLEAYFLYAGILRTERRGAGGLDAGIFRVGSCAT